MPRDFNRGLLSTSRMKVPMSRSPRVINAGSVKPPPMLNSSAQRYDGVEESSKLGTAGNMSFRSLMSLWIEKSEVSSLLSIPKQKFWDLVQSDNYKNPNH